MKFLRSVVVLLGITCAASSFAAHTPHRHHPVHTTAVHQMSHTAHTTHTHHTKAPKTVRVSSPRMSPLPLSPIASSNGVLALNQTLNRLIMGNAQHAAVSVVVKSMQRGDTLYNLNTQNPMTPASTMKLLTAEAALLYLGPNYHFTTQLLTNAKTIKNGLLEGDLYILLSGDPSLTYSDLVELGMTLKAHQINAISGNVYIDNTAYDQNIYGPGWEGQDKGYCYAAPISAGIINHNCLPLLVTPAKVVGRNAVVMTSTQFFYPPIKNDVITKARPRACALHLSADTSSMIALDGCVGRSQNAGVSVVVNNFSEYDRALFKNLFARLSIHVFGSVTFAATPLHLAVLGEHRSEPLNTLVTTMLKKSDNIIAEALFKKLGQLYSHQPGSWQNGSNAVFQILAHYAGVNRAGMRVLDGSGLSPDNLVIPSQMMRVLDFAYHNNATNQDFITALPIAGVDGTLKHRMSNIARKVRAKTGTIAGVAALAGFVQTNDKEPLAFVIMINGNKNQGWRYKTLVDQVTTALTKFHRV